MKLYVVDEKEWVVYCNKKFEYIIGVIIILWVYLLIISGFIVCFIVELSLGC